MLEASGLAWESPLKRALQRASAHFHLLRRRLQSPAAAIILLDHELRKSIFESLGPNAWGMYILLPIPFIALGVIGYLVYRARRASSSDEKPPSLNGN
ncbi:MAG: hypothetical protein N3E42_00505 [Candidatus Bipolaricaulota bacterium]|nr:hypothetical protein [Candidatus Bipolaricaulota bacterium]